MTDGRDISEAVKGAVTGLGGGFMISPEAKAAGKEGGYRGWALYMGGRAGVLGPAPAPVVSAALGFFEPGRVRAGWEAAQDVRPLPETQARYLEICRSWGRNRFAGVQGIERLVELLTGVVERVEPAGLPLFAGWRELPLPDDAPARAAQLLQVLREHRGGAHLMAVRAAGLRPLEAVLAGGGGPGNATFFGWSEPFPEVDERVRSSRDEAERLTSELVAPAYAGLSAAAADELAALLNSAADQVNRYAA